MPDNQDSRQILGVRLVQTPTNSDKSRAMELGKAVASLFLTAGYDNVDVDTFRIVKRVIGEDDILHLEDAHFVGKVQVDVQARCFEGVSLVPLSGDTVEDPGD